MENILNNCSVIEDESLGKEKIDAKNLSEANTDKEYIIKGIETDDEELKNFLLTLGCYQGETVTVISTLGENYIINIKDARYSIDEELAKAILI